METWRFVAAVMMSLTLGLVGIALATNFRGVTEWHGRRSMTGGLLQLVYHLAAAVEHDHGQEEAARVARTG